MKKCLLVLVILTSLLVFMGCQQPTGEIGDSYITNTINIIWKGSFDSTPLNPSVGWAYYDTSKKMSFVWDGLSWQMIAQDGKSIVWKGELSSVPESPEENWAYYNTLDGNSYIYDGFNWGYLAKSGRDGASGIMLWLGSYSEPPISPSVGYCYYNTNDCCSYIWNGVFWDILAKDGTNGVDGKSIIWKGALTSAPLNPEENWTYYDTSSQSSYIWNGTSWNILAQSVGGDTTVQVAINWRGSFTSAPTNPKIGDAYYNSTLKASYIYDGTVWQQISKDGQDGTYTYNGTGYLITWKGSLASAPSNPKAGWAYYNTTRKISYVYDGSSWQIMSKDGETASSNNDTSGTIYLGESTEVLDGTSYIVKKYADVDGGTDYYFTIYKIYYLNNKLRRVLIYYHSVGSDLDYPYTNFVEHTCGTNSVLPSIYTYYENGKVESFTQRSISNGIEVKYITQFDMDGNKISWISYQNAVLFFNYTYFPNGNTKSHASYNTNGTISYYYEYFDSSSNSNKKYFRYNSDGSLCEEDYYFEPNKKELEVDYNTDGTIDDYEYYYESGYLKYYYTDSGYFYTYEDGKTTSSNTSSSYYSSKVAYTNAQAMEKLDTLRPQE